MPQTAEKQKAYRASRPGKTREYQRAYVLRHPGRVKESGLRRYRKHRAYLDSVKSAPCSDCGRSYPPCVMDLDHRDPSTKLFDPALLVSRVGFEKMVEEVAKCDVVCSNCHRLRTFKKSSLSAELTRVRDELAQQREGTFPPMDLLLWSVDWLWEERLILEGIEAKKK